MLNLPVSGLAVSDFNFSSFCCLVTFSFNFRFLLKAVLLLLGTLELVMLSDVTLSFPFIRISDKSLEVLLLGPHSCKKECNKHQS